MTDEKRSHWDKVYSTKQPNELSWTQEDPTTSLEFIHSFNLPKHASIIDIGGGDSKLVDRLIEEGYEDITVLDISPHALRRAQERLGHKAANVNWVVSDITQFETDKRFDVWHDRATFHFMSTADQVRKYVKAAMDTMTDHGFMTIGTFSENGPKKCSGLNVRQYSEEMLESELKKGFMKIRCFTEDHSTPFDTIQNFLFCSFRRQLN